MAKLLRTFSPRGFRAQLVEIKKITWFIPSGGEGEKVRNRALRQITAAVLRKTGLKAKIGVNDFSRLQG